MSSEELENKNCPKCGCFLEFGETNFGVDENCYSEWVSCNNKKCDWVEPSPEY